MKATLILGFPCVTLIDGFDRDSGEEVPLTDNLHVEGTVTGQANVIGESIGHCVGSYSKGLARKVVRVD